ncbi:MAG: hypothetical protein E7406_00550 [Ruminococcaceae bacterium]|nr:hypothetical protein [Oscillospiraceae bacterium]
MREYMLSLGSVLMLIAFSNMILPKGNIKKYVSLATGFIIISTALTVLPGSAGEISFSGDTFSISEEEISKIQAEYSAEVIKKHKENLESMVEEHLSKGAKAYVEVTETGEVTGVSIVSSRDESKAVMFIIENFGIGRERINIKNDKN